MKKNTLIFSSLMMLSLMLIVSACKQQSDPPAKYYIEGGVMDKETLMTIVAPYENKTNLTFDEIKTVRNQLRACTLDDFSSEKDVSEEECRDFLTQHGYTPSEADEAIDSVNNVGNALLFFNVKTSTAKAAFIYAEKQ